MSVIEIAPPYVDTALDAGFRDQVNDVIGEHAPKPMALNEYMDATMKTLEGNNAKDLKEVTIGFAELGVSTWRASFGKVMQGMGIDA